MKNGPFDCSDVFHMGIDIHASGEKSTHQVIQSDLSIPYLEVTWPFQKVT